VGNTFKDLKTMFEAYLNGSVSKDTLIYNMRRLDALDPNQTDEDVKAGIKEPPPLPDPNATPAAPTSGAPKPAPKPPKGK
jgi:hypothetical protein